MNNKLKNLILIAIVLVGSILRLLFLTSTPPHLTPDEASLGYNAYSILKTGKDEYGEMLPVVFKSFGDFKPGLYVYATVPFVAVFGLNEFSTRLPSALSGIIAIYLVYLITRKLFIEDKRVELYSLVAAILLAINPWHIHFSRGAWEINLCLTLTLAGILFFLKTFENKSYLAVSAVFFSLTFLAYQGAKLSTGVVLLILLLTHIKQLIKVDRKVIILSTIIGFFVCLPILVSLFTGKTGRLAVFSVFSYRRPITEVENILTEEGKLNYYFFHSESLNFTRGIMGRYFNHFSGRFLFFEGDWQNIRHSIPNQGLFLIGDLILLPLGLAALVKLKNRKVFWFIFLWLVLAPLPSALSRDQVHAVRSYNLVVPLILINTLGLVTIVAAISRLKRNIFKNLSMTIGLVFYLLGFVYFLDAYFTHLVVHDAKYWMYGYREVVRTVLPIQDKYKEIVVQQDYSQPYIYFLFYGASESKNPIYQPENYQKNSALTLDGSDVGQVERIGNVTFRIVSWEEHVPDGLVVTDFTKVPHEKVNLIKEILYPNGDVAFRIGEVQ